MASRVELTGGRFQNPLGQPIANGHLVFSLTGGEQMGDSASVDGNQIAVGIDVRFNLDANGSVAPGQLIWANDQMTPEHSYYLVTLYTDKGEPIPLGAKRVLGDGGTFDIGEAWCFPFPNTNFILV